MPHAPRRANESPERLAYWYFRLNGFTTIENFVVHHERGTSVRTDVDILATRFKYRCENVENPMQDDERVVRCDTLVNVILAEVKRGDCALNGPWTRRGEGNMQRVLRAVGCTKPDEVESAACQLYRVGRWSNDSTTVRLFALGERTDATLIVGPEQQLEWDSVIHFCISRFQDYRAQKSSVGQWTVDGKLLREFALSGDENRIRSLFGLQTG